MSAAELKWHHACVMSLGMLLAFTQTGSATEGANVTELRNARYALMLQSDGSVQISVQGMPPRSLSPTFTVMSSQKDPGFFRSATHPNYFIAPRTAVRWQNCEEELAVLNPWLASLDTTMTRGVRIHVDEDAQKARTWSFTDAKGQTKKLIGRYAKGTVNPFAAGDRMDLRAKGAIIKDGEVRWTFERQPGFTLTATLALPDGEQDPRVTVQLTVHQPAYYSVAFTGMPAWSKKALLAIPQECMERSGRCDYVMAECDLKLPRVHVWTGEWNQALVIEADQKVVPQPDPSNARFGLMVQRHKETVKAIAFAPLMGGAGSKIEAGGTCSLAVRCVFRPGDWKETYRHIVQNIYRLRDQRDNSGPGSLNGTLERLMDFLDNRNGHNYAMWSDEQKYYDYWSDRSGIYKPFSPMFGLGLAIVTDDESFYKRRALPAVEFALSRNYNVFAPYETVENGQAHSAERTLGGSYLGYAQRVELEGLYQHRTFAIRACAEEKGIPAKSFRDLLAQYQLTGDLQVLSNALRQADMALKKKPLPPALGATPDAFMDWLDLYEATHEPRYLEAAVEGAYGQSLGLVLSPSVPDQRVTVDQGGVAPIHAHSFGRHKRWGFPPPCPLPVPEQTVPAWRSALIGIPSTAYRGEYWMNAHAQLLRVAALSNDDFLRDLARWGMVGRFGCYPGDNCSQRSLVAERPDVADRPIWECTHATINPGHAWEFAGAVLDFLVTDAFHRSAGAIDFPSRSMPDSAFRTKTYGDRPGRFYEEQAVQLWMPRGLLTCSNQQFDYIAGYSGGRLCLALCNQSFDRQQARIRLNPDLVEIEGIREINVWRNNRRATSIRMEKGEIAFEADPKGIVAFVIPGVRVKTRLQAKMLNPLAPKLDAGSVATVQTSFGKVTALLISLGQGLTSAFVYTDALPEQVISARLLYRQGTEPWQEQKDAIFPYEFSTFLDETKGDFECVFEIRTSKCENQRTKPIVLKMRSGI
jgi:hypothetical protein